MAFHPWLHKEGRVSTAMITETGGGAMSAAADTRFPAREQVRSVLDEVLVDRSLHDGWTGLTGYLHKLDHAAVEVTAAAAVCGLLDADLKARTDHSTGDDRLGPAEWLAISRYRTDVYGRWVREVNRYAHLAKVAIFAVAAARFPSPRGHLPGDELTFNSAGPFDEVEPMLPAPFATDVDRLAFAVAQFNLIEAATQEYDERFRCECDDVVDDDDETHESHHIPEHDLELAADLESEMDRYSEYLECYADAVVYTLATDLRPLLRPSPPDIELSPNTPPDAA